MLNLSLFCDLCEDVPATHSSWDHNQYQQGHTHHAHLNMCEDCYLDFHERNVRMACGDPSSLRLALVGENYYRYLEMRHANGHGPPQEDWDLPADMLGVELPGVQWVKPNHEYTIGNPPKRYGRFSKEKEA